MTTDSVSTQSKKINKQTNTLWLIYIFKKEVLKQATILRVSRDLQQKHLLVHQTKATRPLTYPSQIRQRHPM